MKKLIYMLFLMAVAFTAGNADAQGINNNSDFHVPVQVPTIPQAVGIPTQVVAPVAAPELTVTPVTTVANASLIPTALNAPALPAVPNELLTVNNAAGVNTLVTAPTAQAVVQTNNVAAQTVNTPAAGATTVTTVVVTQPIPSLPPVPPLPPIPELQLSVL